MIFFDKVWDYALRMQATRRTLMLSCVDPDTLGTHYLSRSFVKQV
nr:MAG TPA: hypothetical protein [Caudoviricetes sp.]